MIQLTALTFLEVVAIIIVAYLIGHILTWGIAKYTRRAGGFSKPQRRNLGHWIKTITVLLAIVIVLNIIGVDSETELLTIGGIAAFVVGIALQGILGNIFSGILIFKEDTLRLGDLVEVGGGGKGQVVKIGLRNVWIKTESGALVVLGHATLEHGRYWNYTAAERLKKEFDT